MTHSLYLALSPNRAQAFKCCYRGRTEQSKVSSQLYICAAMSPIRTYSGNMDIKDIQLWLDDALCLPDARKDTSRAIS